MEPHPFGYGKEELDGIYACFDVTSMAERSPVSSPESLCRLPPLPVPQFGFNGATFNRTWRELLLGRRTMAS